MGLIHRGPSAFKMSNLNESLHLCRTFLYCLLRHTLIVHPVVQWFTGNGPEIEPGTHSVRMDPCWVQMYRVQTPSGDETRN